MKKFINYTPSNSRKNKWFRKIFFYLKKKNIEIYGIKDNKSYIIPNQKCDISYIKRKKVRILNDDKI